MLVFLSKIFYLKSINSERHNTQDRMGHLGSPVREGTPAPVLTYTLSASSYVEFTNSKGTEGRTPCRTAVEHAFHSRERT